MYVAKYEPFENLLLPLNMSSVYLSVAIEVGNRIRKKEIEKEKKNGCRNAFDFLLNEKNWLPIKKRMPISEHLHIQIH